MRKLFKILKIIILLAVLCAAAAVCAYLVVKVNARGKNFVETANVPYNKVALVLGTSPKMPSGKPNFFFTSRIAAAVRLYKAGKVSYVLVSGDNGSRSYDEPTCMKEALMTAGVPELVYENRTTEMLAFPLNHRLETYGFLIREKMPQHNVKKEAIARYGLTLAEIGTLKRGEDVVREDMVISNEEAAYIPYEPRSYAYCSDTAPFPELAEWVRGATLLYHEATFPEAMSGMAAKTFHSTTLQAARTALDAGVKRLLVGHYSSRYPDVSFFLDELRSIFPATDLAHDLDIIEIER